MKFSIRRFFFIFEIVTFISKFFKKESKYFMSLSFLSP